MSRLPPPGSPHAPTSLDPAVEELLADLVEHALVVTRVVRFRKHVDDSIIRLDGAEAAVMYFIGQHPGVSPSEAARAAGLRPSNLSVTLRSLEGRGMVERRPHPADSRRVRLFSTPLASENFVRVRAEWASLVASELPAPYEGLAETVATLSRLAQAITTRRR